jgi:hypothetical protein
VTAGIRIVSFERKKSFKGVELRNNEVITNANEGNNSSIT